MKILYTYLSIELNIINCNKKNYNYGKNQLYDNFL